jgi:tRNA (guanine37-N1)-methyltransferase
MKIDVLTLFPGMFAGPLDESIVGRARAIGRLTLKIHNLRDYTHDRHRTVDDRPFGGGPGMLLKRSRFSRQSKGWQVSGRARCC